MAHIVPAILPKNLDALSSQLEIISKSASIVQIDIVDGALLPNMTWPYNPGGQEEFERVVSGDEGLPHWDEIDFELDLMVTHAERDAKAWVAAGAARIVVHSESPDSIEALHALQEYRMLESLPTTVGIALPCTANASALDQYSGLYDFVQVMGIEHIGKQGEPFDPRAIMLVQEIKTLYPETRIQVDGGVNLDNAAALVAAGATTLVVGSAIFNTPNPHAAIASLKKKAHVI